jgi:hypothetical protein
MGESSIKSASRQIPRAHTIRGGQMATSLAIEERECNFLPSSAYRKAPSDTVHDWLCLTALELLATFGVMWSKRSRHLCRVGFAAWLLLTTLVCLNPDQAGPHLYGAHEGTSHQHSTTIASFDSSTVTASAPDQACDDEVVAIVPAKFCQDIAAPLQVIAPDTTADATHDQSWLIARVVRVSDSLPGDLRRIVPLRI